MTMSVTHKTIIVKTKPESVQIRTNEPPVWPKDLTVVLVPRCGYTSSADFAAGTVVTVHMSDQ